VGGYVDVRGLRTYYEVRGAGPPVVMLHGGCCPVETFAAQAEALEQRFRVYLPERRANGRTPDVEGPLTYQAMTDDTVAFMQEMEIANADIVGFSDGAIIGLHLTIQHPDLVRTLVSIGGSFQASGLLPVSEMLPRGLVMAKFAPMVEIYERVSPDGPEHFAVVRKKHERMWAEEPNLSIQDLGTIRCPTLVMSADADNVRLEHTLALFRAIPDARLCIVPDSSHLSILEHPALVNRLLLDFLTATSVATTAGAA